MRKCEKNTLRWVFSEQKLATMTRKIIFRTQRRGDAKIIFTSPEGTTYYRVVRERYHIENLWFTSPVWAT